MTVMGNNIMFYDGRPVPARPLTVLEFGGVDLGRPEGDFTFAFPRGVMRAGVLYMLWAEPDGTSRTSDVYDWPAKLTSVWSASWSAPAGWSRPQQVFTGPLNADGDASPSAGAIAAPTLIEFGTTTHRDTVLIVAFKLVATVWQPVLIPVGEGANYPSLAQVGLTIAATFVDGTGGHEFDDNSVFFTRSSDGGETWTPRLLLSRSGRRAAFDTQLLVDRNQQLHLTWRRAVSDSQSSLNHMMSPDAGRSWTEPQELLLPATAYRSRGAVDTCGSVHVVYLDFGKGQEHPQLGYATWRNTWREPRKLFPSLESVGATLHSAVDGSLTIVLLARALTTDATVPYVTMYSHAVP